MPNDQQSRDGGFGYCTTGWGPVLGDKRGVCMVGGGEECLGDGISESRRSLGSSLCE